MKYISHSRDTDYVIIASAGADPGFFKGGLMVIAMYKLYYMYSIIHIIILNKVHCNLLSAIDA